MISSSTKMFVVATVLLAEPQQVDALQVQGMKKSNRQGMLTQFWNYVSEKICNIRFAKLFNQKNNKSKNALSQSKNQQNDNDTSVRMTKQSFDVNNNFMDASTNQNSFDNITRQTSADTSILKDDTNQNSIHQVTTHQDVTEITKEINKATDVIKKSTAGEQTNTLTQVVKVHKFCIIGYNESNMKTLAQDAMEKQCLGTSSELISHIETAINHYDANNYKTLVSLLNLHESDNECREQFNKFSQLVEACRDNVKAVRRQWYKTLVGISTKVSEHSKKVERGLSAADVAEHIWQTFPGENFVSWTVQLQFFNKQNMNDFVNAVLKRIQQKNLDKLEDDLFSIMSKLEDMDCPIYNFFEQSLNDATLQSVNDATLHIEQIGKLHDQILTIKKSMLPTLDDKYASINDLFKPVLNKFFKVIYQMGDAANAVEAKSQIKNLVRLQSISSKMKDFKLKAEVQVDGETKIITIRHLMKKIDDQFARKQSSLGTKKPNEAVLVAQDFDQLDMKTLENLKLESMASFRHVHHALNCIINVKRPLIGVKFEISLSKMFSP